MNKKKYNVAGVGAQYFEERTIEAATREEAKLEYIQLWIEKQLKEVDFKFSAFIFSKIQESEASCAMKQFRVSARGRVFLVSKEVRAETPAQAKEAYYRLWRAGLVEAVGYDMVDYGVIAVPESEVKSDVES